MSQWVGDELNGAKFSDARLGARLQKMIEKLAQLPEASIPQAMGSWSETKAAYRFLNSDKVTPEIIRAGYIQATIKRVVQETRVLIIQDTTMLDFTQHKDTSGLGYLSLPYQRGIVLHSTLACTTEGVPLGMLDQKTWERDLKELGKRNKRQQRPFEEKESVKWVNALNDSIAQVPDTVFSITIADSEADIFELFAAERPPQSDLLIRACRDRRLEGENGKLWQTVMDSPVKKEISVKLEARPKRPARIANCSIRFRQVVISPANHSSKGSKHLKGIPLYAILVLEENTIDGMKPIEWMLLTTLNIDSLEAALQCVKWYSFRWLIEQYHFTLKSGCQIEGLQLESARRLERAIAVYNLVAWRLLWLKFEARRDPEASCESVLEKHEWQALYCQMKRTSTPPVEPPSLRQAVRWIAQLGGFLARKSDGEPGVKTLWLGWRRLGDIADAWLIFHAS